MNYIYIYNSFLIIFAFLNLTFLIKYGIYYIHLRKKEKLYKKFNEFYGKYLSNINKNFTTLNMTHDDFNLIKEKRNNFRKMYINNETYSKLLTEFDDIRRVINKFSEALALEYRNEKISSILNV